MVTFITKQINNFKSVGEKLSNKRQEIGISLLVVSRATKISSRYLEALENGEYSKLPGEIYAKSFLRSYAQYLKLDADQIVSQYISEQKIFSKTQKIENHLDVKKPVERISWHHLLVTPKIIRNFLIGILILICLIYLVGKFRAIVSPPFLQVTVPVNNFLTSQKVIEVTGQVEKEAVLKINGQQVLADGAGNFSETLVLKSGVNIIEVSAEKKHSKQALIYRQVIVSENINQ